MGLGHHDNELIKIHQKPLLNFRNLLNMKITAASPETLFLLPHSKRHIVRAGFDSFQDTRLLLGKEIISK